MGREVEEEIGLVSAAAVRSKSVLSDMYVALSGLVGGAWRSFGAESGGRADHMTQERPLPTRP